MADGTYQPATNPADTNKRFYMQKGINVYGGFVGNEQSRDQRDWSINESLLLGFIDSLDDDPNRVDYIVVADPNSPSSILDGFTIKGAGKAGVFIDNTTIALAHNKISDSGKGVYCLGTEKPIIRNNWLYKNDYGIYFDSPVDIAKVHNNTIADNTIAGLYFDDGTAPEVTNCIFTGHPQDMDVVGCDAAYSYMEYPPMDDPNFPTDIGTGNVNGDPNSPPYVVMADDYHITLDSGCVDAGDPNGIYTGQRDIDKEFRVLGERIDMGADEYCDDTQSGADFNGDEIVNYLDFAILANGWQTTKYIADLQDLASDWLWMSCSQMASVPAETAPAAQQSMMEIPMAMDAMATETPEPTVQEQIAQAESNIEFLDHIWKTDKDVRDDHTRQEWDDFIGSIETRIDELEAGL